MIEIERSVHLFFMKIRNSLVVVVRCREQKKTKDGASVFFKAFANRFWLTWNSCSCFNKVVNDMLDNMYSLLRKSPWKRSLVKQ